MEGVVRAVRSGLSLLPSDDRGATRFFDFMPHVLHLPCKEEVLVDAPKRFVPQLSYRLSCHAPPRCRWSVPGPTVCSVVRGKGILGSPHTRCCIQTSS